MNLGKSLKIALVKKGKKNKDLAEELGISEPRISKWISSGRINQTNVQAICDHLGIKVSEFIAYGEE